MKKWMIVASLCLLLVVTSLEAASPVPDPVRESESQPPVPSAKTIQHRRLRMYERRIEVWHRRALRRAHRALDRARERAVRVARTQLGTPYVWAASSPGYGFDCSGFTLWVAKHFGRYLPHSAAGQSASLPDVSRDHLQPGDLVFFSYGYGIGHTEMYVGDGETIGSSSGGVLRRSLDWAHFVVGGRFLQLRLRRKS